MNNIRIKLCIVTKLSEDKYWYLIELSKVKTILEIQNNIKSRFGIEGDIQFFVDDTLVPIWENAMILRENDTLRVIVSDSVNSNQKIRSDLAPTSTDLLSQRLCQFGSSQSQVEHETLTQVASLKSGAKRTLPQDRHDANSSTTESDSSDEPPAAKRPAFLNLSSPSKMGLCTYPAVPQRVVREPSAKSLAEKFAAELDRDSGSSTDKGECNSNHKSSPNQPDAGGDRKRRRRKRKRRPKRCSTPFVVGIGDSLKCLRQDAAESSPSAEFVKIAKFGKPVGNANVYEVDNASATSSGNNVSAMFSQSNRSCGDVDITKGDIGSGSTGNMKEHDGSTNDGKPLGVKIAKTIQYNKNSRYIRFASSSDEDDGDDSGEKRGTQILPNLNEEKDNKISSSNIHNNSAQELQQQTEHSENGTSSEILSSLSQIVNSNKFTPPSRNGRDHYSSSDNVAVRDSNIGINARASVGSAGSAARMDSPAPWKDKKRTSPAVLLAGAQVYSRKAKKFKKQSYHPLSKQGQLDAVCTNKSIIIQNTLPPVPVWSPQSSRTEEEQENALEFKDYTLFPVVRHVPSVGSKIAFKTLELTDSYTPEISAYKEGVVESYQADSETLEISITTPVRERATGRFDVMLEGMDYVLTNRDSLETIRVPWTSLVEPRLLT